VNARRNRDGSTLAADNTAHSEPTMGTERSFGAVFAAVFALIGCWPLLDGAPPRAWALALAGGFLAAAILKPAWLAPLNRLWFQFGLLLGRIIAPIVLGAVYCLAVLPTALILRLSGHDPLKRRFEPDRPSYWLRRETAPGSMKQQF